MTIAVLRNWTNEQTGETGTHLIMWCPGCVETHTIEVDPSHECHWTWNGMIDSPTIMPSIKREGVQWEQESGFHKPTHAVAAGNGIVCHSFVRGGQWDYLPDSTHHLKGQTVPLPPIPANLEIG